MSRRGEMSALGIVVTVVLALLVIWVVVKGPINIINNATAAVLECPGACSSTCDAEYSSEYWYGETYCEYSSWNVEGVEPYSTRIDNAKDGSRLTAYKNNKKAVVGEDLGLTCCYLRTEEGLPDKYLREDRWVGSVDKDARTSYITQKPRIIAYFADDANPVASGSYRDIVSSTPVNLRFELHNVADESGIKADKGGDTEPDYSLEKECSAKLLDEDSKEVSVNIANLDKICEGFESDNKKINLQLTLPSSYEDRVLELQVVVSKDKGLYQSDIPTDTIYNLFLRVRNPIRLTGFTGAYVWELPLEISCYDQYYDCESFMVADSLTETEASDCSAVGLEYISAVPTTPGKARYTVTTPGYVCFNATTKTQENLYYRSVTPVKIDRKPPVFENNDFNFLKLQTNVTCKEDPTTGSGCASAVGYYYIYNPLQFAADDCSDAHASYTWAPAARISTDMTSAILSFQPQQTYVGKADIAVMCVRIKDNAGNINQRAVVTYNVVDDLINILGNQIQGSGLGW